MHDRNIAIDYDNTLTIPSSHNYVLRICDEPREI